jgi:tRNA A-37 threonylcarbamoyl transferase component Bud32
MELLEIRKEIVSNLKGDLPDFVDKLNYFIIQKLKGRKNSVVKLAFIRPTKHFPKNIVIKIFRTINAQKEYSELIKLKNQDLMVPNVLYFKNPFLILNYLEGENLCDLINGKLVDVQDLSSLDNINRKKIEEALLKLAEWLGNLHLNNLINKEDITVLNKGDTRLRDFIFNPETGQIYGTDFEEAYIGNPIDDLAWVCCSLLDTNPGVFEMNDPKLKIDLINYFLKSYYEMNPGFEFNFTYFAERLIEDLNEVMRRRNLQMSLNKTSFIKEISRHI